MARKSREEKDREQAMLEERAERTYTAGLARLADVEAAQRFANNGPPGQEPGASYYHNLGCFLHRNPFRASRWEWEALVSFAERAEAAGNAPVGFAAAARAGMQRAEETRDFRRG
ncbi:hypothetical protein WMF18_17120 [Sorangium sp. So ce315]|uniref:hypothetical protein n=1 Tax=Sorangium sp. So ce315 TaxID=3133299 RepID=UPI003F6345E5